ncbi:MAG: hypothetical protein AB1324_01755 [Candidatus Micrarchaeota archaeon]
MMELGLAMAMLDSARVRAGRQDYLSALADCKNAIRLASSALLRRDGCVCESLEETISYLAGRYPGSLPLNEWRGLEEALVEGGHGLYNMLMEAMGKVKKAGPEEAYGAIGIAEQFIARAREEMGE